MSAGVSGKAMDVMFGRTDQQKVATWLAWTEGRRIEFARHKWEHQLRRRVWRRSSTPRTWDCDRNLGCRA